MDGFTFWFINIGYLPIYRELVIYVGNCAVESEPVLRIRPRRTCICQGSREWVLVHAHPCWQTHICVYAHIHTRRLAYRAHAIGWESVSVVQVVCCSYRAWEGGGGGVEKMCVKIFSNRWVIHLGGSNVGTTRQLTSQDLLYFFFFYYSIPVYIYIIVYRFCGCV